MSTPLYDAQGNLLNQQEQINKKIKESREERMWELNITREINDSIREQLNLLDGHLDAKRAIRRMTTQANRIAEQNFDLTKADYEIALDREAISKRLAKARKLEASQRRELNYITVKLNQLKEEGNKKEEETARKLQRDLGESRSHSEYVVRNIHIADEALKKLEKHSAPKWFEGFEEITSKIPLLNKFNRPLQLAAKASRKAAAEMTRENIEFEQSVNKFNQLLKDGYTEKSASKEVGVDLDILKKGRVPNLPRQLNLEAAKAGFRALGGVISKAFGPVSLAVMAIKGIQAIVKQMFKASAEVAELQKTFTMTRDEAEGLRQAMYDSSAHASMINRELGGAGITLSMYQKAFHGINEQLGAVLNFSQDFSKEINESVGFTAILTENLGLSSQAANNIFLQSMRLGKSSREYSKEILGRLTYLGFENNLMFDQNKMLEEISTLSGELRLHYYNSGRELANTVYQSRMLGISLGSVQNISKGLLDFESSINNEMEARMLTGMDINLGAARYHALMGDTGKVMKEITSQGMTQEKFSRMNVIAREAYAQAVGMSVDELSDQLIKEEENLELQQRRRKVELKIMADNRKFDMEQFDFEKDSYEEIIRKAREMGVEQEKMDELLGESAVRSKQAESAQDRWNKVLEEARQIFSRLIDSGMLDAFVDKIEDLSESWLFASHRRKRKRNDDIEWLESNLGEDDRITQKLIEEVKNTKTSKSVAGILWDQIKQTSSQGGIMTSGLVDIYKAIKGEETSISGWIDLFKHRQTSSKIDALRTPSKVYEDFILRPGQPPIPFRKDDLIIGGTKLDEGLSQSSSPSSSNERTNQLLEQLISLVAQGGDVNLDGYKVGQVLTMNSSQLG